MSETRFHGARTKEETDLITAINDIDSSVIGLVAVADDADEDAFPLNTPILLTRVQSVLGKAGKTGTLYKTLKAISDQCSPKVIVVRVAEAKPAEEGEEAQTQSQLIIGGSDADGNYTGMYALLTAEQKTDYRPRILIVPEYDTEEVTSQLCVIAKQLRAFVYASCNGCKTIAEARAYRKTFASRELMLLWPNFIAYNLVTCTVRTTADTTKPLLTGMDWRVHLVSRRGISRRCILSVMPWRAASFRTRFYPVRRFPHWCLIGLSSVISILRNEKTASAGGFLCVTLRQNTPAGEVIWIPTGLYVSGKMSLPSKLARSATL